MLCKTLFVVLLAVPCSLSRHLEHSESRREVTVHDNLQGDDEKGEVAPLLRSHLRLHAKPPRVLQTIEGASEVLECQAGGSPLPRIYWMKNGKEIPQPEDYSDDLTPPQPSPDRLDIGSTSSRLYIACASAADEGAEYACVAENGHHREMTTTRLRVASSGEERGCTAKHGLSPRIVSWTKTVLENQGQDALVSCRASGSPSPVVQWRSPRDDVIVHGDKYQISSNGDLLIRNLKWKDMGNYVCLAENIHGTARAEVFVYPATPET